jgi:hypothetical protein
MTVHVTSSYPQNLVFDGVNYSVTVDFSQQIAADVTIKNKKPVACDPTFWDDAFPGGGVTGAVVLIADALVTFSYPPASLPPAGYGVPTSVNLHFMP